MENMSYSDRVTDDSQLRSRAKPKRQAREVLELVHIACCSILSDQKGTQRNNPVWGCSSAGRAPALQAGGHGFDSHHLHQFSSDNAKHCRLKIAKANGCEKPNT